MRLTIMQRIYAVAALAPLAVAVFVGQGSAAATAQPLACVVPAAAATDAAAGAALSGAAPNLGDNGVSSGYGY